VEIYLTISEIFSKVKKHPGYCALPIKQRIKHIQNEYKLQ